MNPSFDLIEEEIRALDPEGLLTLDTLKSALSHDLISFTERFRLFSDGPGDEAFYGRNPGSNWNLFIEVTHGFAKDNGFCLAVTPDEYAEVHEVMSKRPGFRAVGMWEFKGEFFPPRRREVIGTISANQWNGLYPSTKRIIRTVVMDTDHWTDEEVLEYIDIARKGRSPLSDLGRCHHRARDCSG